jgi:hypothetical protein
LIAAIRRRASWPALSGDSNELRSVGSVVAMPRRAGPHRAFDERQCLTALVVEPEESRGGGEADTFEMDEQRFDNVGTGRSRPANGVTDPNHCAGVQHTA